MTLNLFSYFIIASNKFFNMDKAELEKHQIQWQLQHEFSSFFSDNERYVLEKRINVSKKFE